MRRNSKVSFSSEIICAEGIGEVEVRRSWRARRISLSVRTDGGVRLTVPARGSVCDAMRFLESKTDWVAAARKRMGQRVRVPEILVPTPAEISAAKIFLPRRLAELAQKYGFIYERVTVRTMKSRWGSCSVHNDISLNTHLMRLPEHLRDYVLLHELCHTVHHNHGAGFHSLLSRHTSGHHPILRKELRKYRLQ